MFTKENTEQMQEINVRMENKGLLTRMIVKEDIVESTHIQKKIKRGKAPGPDGIHPRYIKEIYNE